MSICASAPGMAPGAVAFCADMNSSRDAMAAGSLDAQRAHGQSPGMRLGAGGRWFVFILLSIALHASFLWSGSRAPMASSAPGLSWNAHSVDVRLIGAPDATPEHASVESEWKPLQPLPVQHARHARMLDFVPVDLPRTEIDESAYLPISRVTLRPTPATTIAVPYPAGVDAAASTEARIVLFIDEDGGVAKVALAKDQAPTPFALSAIATFERVRYRPALLDGKPVKVRVVVAVTFEDRQAKAGR